MLIQLLNIAGIGPVIGVIIGIKFGVVAFLIIPIGNILAGAVHDFLAGMISMRYMGANLPKIVGLNLGRGYARFFSSFMVVVLLLVVAVFINVPANLIGQFNGSGNIFWYAVAGIFIYYIAATLFPVDKIIGMFYPIFGGVLVVGSLAIFVALLIKGFQMPELLTESAAFKAGMKSDPIIPVLFVTIACGIISGFHATQSPIIARTMSSERQGRQSFYGMMVLEGVIAMIWAAAALMIYNLYPEYMGINAAKALSKITVYFLGSWMGNLTVIGVIILAITSGDTAMRSLRLSFAEIFHVNQKHFGKRFLICIPLILVVMALLVWSNRNPASFNQLWNYFSWSNQVLAASTLMAATVWLIREKKAFWIALLPGMFMCFIIFSYILWVSPGNSKGGPVGFGLPLPAAYILAGVMTLAAGALVYWYAGNVKRRVRHMKKREEELQ